VSLNFIPIAAAAAFCVRPAAVVVDIQSHFNGRASVRNIFPWKWQRTHTKKQGESENVIQQQQSKQEIRNLVLFTELFTPHEEEANI